MLKPATDSLGEKFDVGLLIVQAGDLLERFAAGGHEIVAALFGDFLDGFEAIGDEGGADNEQAFLAGLGQALELVVGERREPGFAGEAGLKGNGVFVGGNAGASDECARGGENLGFVTGGVRGRARGAAIGDERAMRFG